MKDKPRFTLPGAGETHEAYSFLGTNGLEVHVPALVEPSTRYTHQSMSRDEAVDVQIAFGLETQMPSTIKATPNGLGFTITIPAEWLRDTLLGLGRLPL